LTERIKVNSHSPEKEMAAHLVSALVDNRTFDDPRCVELDK
jgi:hypothetical protein